MSVGIAEIDQRKGASRMIRCMALVVVLATSVIGGCAYKPSVDQRNVDELAQGIMLLGPGIDPEEAERAAQIAFYYSLQLAQEYNITDPPLIHNEMVHKGLRERGLCNHWAEDLSKRLNQENFKTLTVQRAISPPTPLRIIHHTAVITKRGETIYDGIVIDPWRYGGNLFWSQTKADERFNWRPREEVLIELNKASQKKAAANVN